ncbi:kinase-like domain-containing protein [Pilobolus umbonatus]|nr:kinase-like domain-containing protein [Pilobolus umbonatus]
MVYSALYIPQNKRVAIKVIDLDMFERNQIDELRRETALMALSKHPNVLQVYGSFVNGSKLYIITPYMALGSCLDIMKFSFPDGLDEITIATILKQALEGIAYLHKNGHIHRDVKAGNLLMDEDGTVLLADFGVSSSLMETGERGVRKTFVGTPCWMAPEVMEQADYDYKADIWSFGITAIELATGHAPFAKHPPLKVLMMTLSNDPPTLSRETTKNKFSKVFKEMIDSCMNKDPTKRPSSEKLLQHPFFKQAKKPEWLTKNVIQDIPHIEQRPLKKLPHKEVASISTDEWDFNEEKESRSPDINIFGSDNKPPLVISPRTPKRHISFGHVVVRKNTHHAASESWSYSVNRPNNQFTDIPPLPNASYAQRKTRALSDDFIVESSRISSRNQPQTDNKSEVELFL